MNAQKYTQKSLEAVQAAQSLATEYGNQQIEQPHLLLALLSDEAGLIPQLLGNMGLTGSRARSMWPRTWTSASTPPSPLPPP